MNLPNKLTIARMCMIPFMVLALQAGLSEGIALPMETARLIGMGIFILAAVTDFLDGFIARRYSLSTDFGKFMDPLADKVLVMSAMVYMVVLGDISPWIFILMESREFIIAGVRMIAANKNVVISAGVLGKAKTVVQMIMIPTVLANLPHPFFDIAGTVLIYAALALTVVSAIDYIWNNRGVLRS
ncbi:MAG: CDP-diacylglycerol--glycerol-3-phosphate 3-phosphatidyltransferase [Clostridiales bacterium]|jgi:CDP-diacylglycerol--glycerol-3-phosphate 3-phosphatidyltransferase|nr:CDP-diacylglycerol--glycerol-3-phosphate 3-phosphatidyltransferase [Clostridiales bacterium]